MRALALTRRPAPGTLADSIGMSEIAEPRPGFRDVLVRVLASTINIDDIHVAEGTFYGGIPIGPRPRPGRPVTPGSDLSGVVIGAGKGVRSLHAGDAVFGVQIPFRSKGAWAEICAIDERWLTPKPDNVPFPCAAACGISGLVALSAIRALKLRRGSRIVVVGATGGIGGMAVQFATRAGAEVIGVCGPAHVDRAYQLGCSLVLDYKTQPWEREISTHIDGVLDLVGGGDVEHAGRSVLDRDGIFVTVVGPERFIGDRPLGWTGIVRVLATVGWRIVKSRFRGPRYVLTGPGAGAGRDLRKVAEAAATGILPPIDSTVPFALQPMRQALRRAAEHRNNGRIVVDMTR
ncbi:MAG: NADP-dependent oxidoreductase [Acidobacteriia bacterium]|nr:NADP-dependent oxidoreductase [Terriglobia bacterium]